MSDAAVPAPGPLERQRGSLTDETRAEFLAALEQGWTVTAAARMVGLARKTMYDARSADAGFAAAWADAYAAGADVLVDEARRRAVEGWDEPVYQGGEQVGVVRRFSDPLLLALLRAHFAAFRESMQVTLGGQAQVAVAHEVPLTRDGRGPSTLAGVIELAVKVGALGAKETLEALAAAAGETVDGVAVELPELEEGSHE